MGLRLILGGGRERRVRILHIPWGGGLDLEIEGIHRPRFYRTQIEMEYQGSRNEKKEPISQPSE